jgi:HlyD family secretion protein
MAKQRNKVFRERSLGGLSSPERLDQLLRIVRPGSWLLVLIVGLGLTLALTWAVVGRIPVTASGTAILVRPKQVVPFQSPASGPLAEILIDIGDRVAPGDLLARLRLPGLEKELEQERARLELFDSQTTELGRLEHELAENERAFIAEQRELLRARIASIQAAADEVRDETTRYIAEQRENLDTARRLSTELEQAQAQRYDSQLRLIEDGINSADALVLPLSDRIGTQLRLAELDVEEKELKLRQILAQDEYDKKIDLIQDLSIQLSQLDLREMSVTRRLREDELGSASDREAIQRRIAELTVQLENDSRVLSVSSGRIVEITVSPGQQVGIGQRLGKMEIEDPSADLMTLAYFQVKDGKKIKAGDKIRTSPSTVERERFGAMLGSVTSVSDYPVTIEAAAHQIGDLETARTLLRGETRIEVVAALERAGERFVWTSGDGPENVHVTAGTTAEVRVTIEEIAPITLVLPFLKNLMGG